MNPCIRSGDAPGYTVVTVITVFDSLGYCRIGRLVAALKPIRRISRLTTTDNTGRLMKISVQTIAMRSDRQIMTRLKSDHDLPSLFEHDLFGKPASTFSDHA